MSPKKFNKNILKNKSFPEEKNSQPVTRNSIMCCILLSLEGVQRTSFSPSESKHVWFLIQRSLDFGRGATSQCKPCRSKHC